MFGKDVMDNKCISCQWHFKWCAVQKSREVREEDHDDFLQSITQLTQAATVAHYIIIMKHLQNISEHNLALPNWLKWWDVRRSTMFAPFYPLTTTKSNLAEVGNAGWKQRHPLALVDVAKDDVTSMILQCKELEAFRPNATASAQCSHGPAQNMRDTKEILSQIACAKQYAEVMSNTAAIAVKEEMASSQLKFEPAKSVKQKPLKKNKKDNIKGKFCKLNNPGQLPLLNELSQRISQSQTRGEQEPIYSSKDPLMLKIN